MEDLLGLIVGALAERKKAASEAAPNAPGGTGQKPATGGAGAGARPPLRVPVRQAAPGAPLTVAKPSPSAPQPSALEMQLRTLSDPDPFAPAAPGRAPIAVARTARIDVLAALRAPGTLAASVVIAEILGPPLSLRPPKSGP